MSRIPPDEHDVLVYTLSEGTTTHTNYGTAGSSANWVEYGTPVNKAMGLFEIENKTNALYIPSTYLVNARNGAGGANDVIVSPHVSLSGWVYLRRYVNYAAVIFNKQYHLNNWVNPWLTFGFQSVNSTDGQLDLYITINGVLQTLLRTPTSYTMPLGRWFHLGGTWDGSTVRMYINGSLVISGNYSGTIDYNSNSARGQWYTGGIPGTNFNQDPPIIVQDIRVANIARPQSYFAEIYYNGFTL